MFTCSSFKKNAATYAIVMCLVFSHIYTMSSLPSLNKLSDPINQDSSLISVCRVIQQLTEFEYTGDDITLDFNENYEPVISLDLLSNLIAHSISLIKENLKKNYKIPLSSINDLLDEKQGINAKAYIVSPTATIISIGDLHGNAHSLTRIIDALLKNNLINEEGFLAQDAHLIFTGDLGDRGHYSIETWYLALLLLCKNPQKVTILQGNHETKILATQYGIFSEFEAKYKSIQNDRYHDIISHAFFELFYLLPQTCFVGALNANNMYVFTQYVHAGLPDFITDENKDFSLQFNELLDQVILSDNNNATIIYSKAPKHNGLIWNSFYSYPNPSTISASGNRYRFPNCLPQDKKFHGIAILKYLESHSKPNIYSVCGIIRGHDHLQHISQLAYNENPNRNTNFSQLELENWSPINCPVLVQIDPEQKSFPVFSVSSLASAFDYDNFITMTFNNHYQTWQINPFSKHKTNLWKAKSQDYTPYTGLLINNSKRLRSVQTFFSLNNKETPSPTINPVLKPRQCRSVIIKRHILK